MHTADTLLSGCCRWMTLRSQRTAPAQQALPRRLCHVSAHLPRLWARQASVRSLAALTQAPTQHTPGSGWTPSRSRLLRRSLLCRPSLTTALSAPRSQSRLHMLCLMRTPWHLKKILQGTLSESLWTQMWMGLKRQPSTDPQCQTRRLLRPDA